MAAIIESIIASLRERGENLSTAESITGGGLGAAITSVAGASDIYRGGVVAYSNDVKIAELGVGAAVIDSYGVVSKEVVVAMAEGARKKFATTWAIATTGVAGPGSHGGVPAGTVWVAIAGPTADTFQLQLSGERLSVQNATITSAIEHFARILRG